MEGLLLECGFPSELAGELSSLNADNLEHFLERVHARIQASDELSSLYTERWPSDGLADRPSRWNKAG